ncbi:MAG: cobalamin biosynthesis protein [Pseudomonadota bacterium]
MTRKPRPIAVYALTSPAAGTARKIAACLPEARLFLPSRLARPGEQAFEKLPSALAENFHLFQGHVVVAAAGIVVRALAYLLADKASDPAVVVVDQDGRFAVSLLSGHLGGANELARKAALILGGQAVITTGTDASGKPGLELIARDQGLKIENIEALSPISRMVLEGEAVEVYDPENWLRPALSAWPDSFTLLSGLPSPPEDRPLVLVSHDLKSFPDSWLLVRPPSLAVGLGCNRGTSREELEQLLGEVLAHYGLSPDSLSLLASIEAKRKEPGLLALAEKLNLEIAFFPAHELESVSAPTPSAAVKKHMGVASVCEAAAMLAAGTDRLLVRKQKSANATLAVALISSGS